MSTNYQTGKQLTAKELADELNNTAQAINQQLSDMGLIINKTGIWSLTPAGTASGGSYLKNKYHTIIWPQSMKDILKRNYEHSSNNLLNSTSIGNHFGISAQRTNYFFSEIGWIKRVGQGWQPTELGARLGGKEYKHEVSGESLVRWPKNIINHPALTTIIHRANVITSTESHDRPQHISNDEQEFIYKSPGNIQAIDGHWVKSKAEKLIDDYLCSHEIIHYYEKSVISEEGKIEMVCDFYLPGSKVYIEYWGLEDNPQYLANKKRKQEIYHKRNIALIELTDKHMENLEDTLDILLKKKGIKL